MNKGRKPDLGNWKVKAITGVIIGFSILAIIGLLVTVIGVKTKKIIFMYNELSGKPNSSYGQFNHRGIYVTKDANGNLVISFNQPGSSNTDGNVNGVDEVADDLDDDGLPDDIDPKPLIPNECTCSVKCTDTSHDDDCELCSIDYTKCKAAPTNTGEKWAIVSGNSVDYFWGNPSVFSNGTNPTQTLNGFPNREFGTAKTYTEVKWTKGTNQQKTCDAIKSEVSDVDGYVMYKGAVLMAAPVADSSWVGCFGEVIAPNGKSIKVFYIDTKGKKGSDVTVCNVGEDPNTTWYGHAMGTKANVCEFCMKAKTTTEINSKFGTNFDNGTNGPKTITVDKSTSVIK